MKRVVTLTDPSTFASADFNTIQDRMLGIVALDQNNNLAPFDGCRGGLWQGTGSLSAAQIAILSAPIVDAHDPVGTGDWRDRMVWGRVFLNSAADNQRIGQANDYNIDSLVSGSVPFRFKGYLGTGAYHDLTGTPVSATKSPVRGAGTVRSYFVNLASTDSVVMLYADPTNGSLCIYNNSGGSISAVLLVHSIGKTGKRT